MITHTHLEPDILECEVSLRSQLGSITMNIASGGDGIAVELFQILKDDAVKVLHSICQQIGKLSSGHRTGKGQYTFQSERKAMPRNAQTVTQLHSSHMLRKWQPTPVFLPGESHGWRSLVGYSLWGRKESNTTE